MDITHARLIERAEQLLSDGGRVLGIAGQPGAGKSTLADTLLQHFRDRAQLLPLDGFHLADEELSRRGLLRRKGAHKTFDVDGYLSVLRRVRDRSHPVMAPRFDRRLEAAIAGSICIEPSVQLVITEGNYLMLGIDRWAEVNALMDERWMLELDPEVRVRRLVRRHVEHGRTADAALRWVADVDEQNARFIEQHSVAADLVVSVVENAGGDDDV